MEAEERPLYGLLLQPAQLLVRRKGTFRGRFMWSDNCSVRALATPSTNDNMTTPTPASKLPISALTKRVSKLGLLDKPSTPSLSINTPASAVRTRKAALAPSTPANHISNEPPVTAIRIRKPAIPRPTSVAGRATSVSSPAVKKEARISLVQAGSTMTRGGPSSPSNTLRGMRSTIKGAAEETLKRTMNRTAEERASLLGIDREGVPARRSTRLAKTSSSSTESKASVINKTPVKAANSSLPSRQSLSYTSPPKYDFLAKDPNHSTPQRPPKTSTQPYEDLKARWRRNNNENGSPGMLLNDSPIAKLHGGVISLDEMDDREVELEMLRKEIETLREEVESVDVEKVTLVEEVERLGTGRERAETSMWRSIVAMAEIALEEEHADAQKVAASLDWVASLDDLARSLE